jgi:Binding-protein-dependent transport system inner membrane component
MQQELSEAALIDGASHFTILRRIFLPLSLPVLAALLIVDFVATWNEFAMALVILQANSTWTLPLGLMSFQSQFQSDYGQLNAASAGLWPSGSAAGTDLWYDKWWCGLSPAVQMLELQLPERSSQKQSAIRDVEPDSTPGTK